MISHENLNPPLATLEQATAVLRESNDLTKLYANARNTYELQGSGAPAEVTAHFPPYGPESTGEVTSVRVMQGRDAHTEGAKREGSAATISFFHWDHHGQDVSYVTQVDYTINTGTAGVIQPMERHIINYEVGSRKSSADIFSRLLDHMIEGPEAAQARHDEAHAAERSAGLGDVTAKEAAQILRFLEGLKLDAADTVNPEFMAMLRNANIEPRKISLDRRLIDHRSTAIQEVAEVFSQSLQQRLIIAREDNPNVAASQVLEEGGIPFLQTSDARAEGLRMWEVPAGSFTLRSVVGNVAQNPERYGEILTMAQNVIQGVDNAGLGITLTDERKLLDHLIVIPDQEAGCRVVLAPPVQLSTETNPQANAVTMLQAEIIVHAISQMSQEIIRRIMS